MLPKSVTDKLLELADALDAETARALANQILGMIFITIPGFPTIDFSGWNLLDLQQWGAEVVPSYDWPVQG